MTRTSWALCAWLATFSTIAEAQTPSSVTAARQEAAQLTLHVPMTTFLVGVSISSVFGAGGIALRLDRCTSDELGRGSEVCRDRRQLDNVFVTLGSIGFGAFIVGISHVRLVEHVRPRRGTDRRLCGGSNSSGVRAKPVSSCSTSS